MAHWDTTQALQLLRSGPEGIEEWNRLRADGVEVSDVRRADLRRCDLSGADLSHLDFARSDFSYANLSRSNLDHTVLTNATLSHADLTGAVLTHADLSRAVLESADLQKADLQSARLIESNLKDAKLRDATFGGTVIASDLSRADPEGLKWANHPVSSHITFDSVRQFNGNLPREFLRGCQVDDRIIDLLVSRSAKGREPTPSRFENKIYVSGGDIDMSKREIKQSGEVNIAAQDGSIDTGDIQVVKDSIVQSDKLDPGLKQELEQLCQAIRDSKLPEEDKKAAARDVASVTREAEKDDPRPGRIRALLDGIKALAPTVESIIGSTASVARLLGLG